MEPSVPLLAPELVNRMYPTSLFVTCLLYSPLSKESKNNIPFLKYSNSEAWLMAKRGCALVESRSGVKGTRPMKKRSTKLKLHSPLCCLTHPNLAPKHPPWAPPASGRWNLAPGLAEHVDYCHVGSCLRGGAIEESSSIDLICLYGQPHLKKEFSFGKEESLSYVHS